MSQSLINVLQTLIAQLSGPYTLTNIDFINTKLLGLLQFFIAAILTWKLHMEQNTPFDCVFEVHSTQYKEAVLKDCYLGGIYTIQTTQPLARSHEILYENFNSNHPYLSLAPFIGALLSYLIYQGWVEFLRKFGKRIKPMHIIDNNTLFLPDYTRRIDEGIQVKPMLHQPNSRSQEEVRNREETIHERHRGIRHF